LFATLPHPVTNEQGLPYLTSKGIYRRPRDVDNHLREHHLFFNETGNIPYFRLHYAVCRSWHEARGIYRHCAGRAKTSFIYSPRGLRTGGSTCFLKGKQETYALQSFLQFIKTLCDSSLTFYVKGAQHPIGGWNITVLLA